MSNEHSTFNAVLYHLNQNGLQKRLGIMDIHRTPGEIRLGITDLPYAKFFYQNAKGQSAYYSVSSKPGIISNRAVWFETEQDDKAIDLLINYEMECIKELKRKIQAHELLINELNSKK